MWLTKLSKKCLPQKEQCLQKYRNKLTAILGHAEKCTRSHIG